MLFVDAVVLILLLDLFKSGVLVALILLAVFDIEDRFNLGVVATVELTFPGVFK